LEELDGPRQVIPATVVLEDDGCAILTLSVRLEGEALVHGALREFERDVREVLKHPVGLQARDVPVEEQVTSSFLPFLDVKGFRYGLAVYTDEPKCGDIIVDV
jgi:hypothetical protein